MRWGGGGGESEYCMFALEYEAEELLCLLYYSECFISLMVVGLG